MIDTQVIDSQAKHYIRLSKHQQKLTGEASLSQSSLLEFPIE